MFLSSVFVPSSDAPAGRTETLASHAQAPLLHVHVGDAELLDRRPQQLGPLARLRRVAQVGLGDDLDQRRPAAVEVDQRGAGAVDAPRLADVDQLRRVLLEVDAVDADVSEPAAAWPAGCRTG